MSFSYQQHGEYAVLTMAGGGLFNPNTLAQMNDILDKAHDDKSVEALIITGEDNIFSQGLDLAVLQTFEPMKFYTFVEESMEMIGRLLKFPIPVISAINGHAFGLGAMLVMASDYRVMRKGRGFICLPEVDLGMRLPTSMNSLVRHKLPDSIRAEMVLAGARIPAEVAEQHGVVNCSVDLAQLLDKAKEIAQPAMGKKRPVFAGLKEKLHEDILCNIGQPLDIEAAQDFFAGMA